MIVLAFMSFKRVGASGMKWTEASVSCRLHIVKEVVLHFCLQESNKAHQTWGEKWPFYALLQESKNNNI